MIGYPPGFGSNGLGLSARKSSAIVGMEDHDSMGGWVGELRSVDSPKGTGSPWHKSKLRLGVGAPTYAAAGDAPSLVRLNL